MFQNKTLSLVFKSTKWDIHSYGLPSFSPYSQVEGPGYSWGESSDIVSKPVKKTTSPMLCFPFFGVCISVALLWASCWQGQLASCGVIVCSVFLKAIPLAKWGTRASLCLTASQYSTSGSFLSQMDRTQLVYQFSLWHIYSPLWGQLWESILLLKPLW